MKLLFPPIFFAVLSMSTKFLIEVILILSFVLHNEPPNHATVA